MADRQIMDANPPEAKAPLNSMDEMSFLDHLEEFRWRIFKGLFGLAAGVAVALIFTDFIMDVVLLGPTQSTFFVYDLLGINAVDLSLQNRRLPGQFFTYWGTILVVGGIIGSPVFFYQFWAFLTPAFSEEERKGTRFTVLNITLLFVAGVLFGYLVLTPFALQFFNQFHISDMVRNDFDINAYFSSLTMWTISCGFVFQLPMASYILSKMGLLTPEFLITYRRHAIIVCFILAAFITPPDPISQFMIGIPLIFLYQFAIYVSKVTNRRRDKKIWGEDGKPGE
ncbi:MAG: twin-arginine translocase subunit TatC [Balneolales bacterium]